MCAKIHTPIILIEMSSVTFITMLWIINCFIHLMEHYAASKTNSICIDTKSSKRY